MVSDYTGLNFNEVIDLDCITFRILFKDAFINELSKTEEGREQLESAYILTLTSPDRDKLRDKFGQEVKINA